MLFKKITGFRDANQIFGVCVFLPGNTRNQFGSGFLRFSKFSESPRFRAYKNEHNLQPGALKVTKSEFFDKNCVSFVSLWSDGRTSGRNLDITWLLEICLKVPGI